MIRVCPACQKLARIIYTLVSRGIEYDDSVFAKFEQRNDEKQRRRFIKQARKLGYALVPINNSPGPAAEAVVS